jgi:hypothetical protein
MAKKRTKKQFDRIQRGSTTRKYNGRLFHQRGSYLTKTKAKRSAAWLRDKGNSLARVVKLKKGYVVYYRQKKTSKKKR